MSELNSISQPFKLQLVRAEVINVYGTMIHSCLASCWYAIATCGRLGYGITMMSFINLINDSKCKFAYFTGLVLPELGYLHQLNGINLDAARSGVGPVAGVFDLIA